MDTTGFLIMDIGKRLKHSLNLELAQSDITLAQWALIAHLGMEQKPLTAAEIAAAIDMDKPTISGIIRRLTDKGLLASVPKPDDRRAMSLSLTAAGRATFTTCSQTADRVQTKFLASLTPNQQSTFTKLLMKLEAAN